MEARQQVPGRSLNGSVVDGGDDGGRDGEGETTRLLGVEK